MGLRDKFSRFERFHPDWRRLLLQGAMITLAGAILALASVFNPNVVSLHAYGFSWLPVSGLLILSMGLVECLDAYLAPEQRDFLQNLHVGILDTVVGALIVLGVSAEPARLSLMIAAFLIVRGIVRATLVYALQFPHAVSTTVAGGVSVLMGILVWLEWPTPAGWFLAFCLNTEIAFRGWAMMMFALWVRKRQGA